MKNIANLTGTTIYSHFRYLCPYHTWQLIHTDLPDQIPTPSDRLLMESGIKHEDQALAYFLKEYRDECEIISGDEKLDIEDNFKFRFEQTLEAMEAGKSIIYHGILEAGGKLSQKLGDGLKQIRILRGETDFLFRVDRQNGGKFSGYHYEVGDAKSSRSSKFCQQMQVTFYSWLLEAAQSVMPDFGRILTHPLGVESESKPFKEESFLIDDYFWTLRTFLEEELPEILVLEGEDFFYHPISSCETCLFFDRCTERATGSNDLSLLPDIRKIQKRSLNRQNVVEIKQLARTKDTILIKAAKGSGVTFEGLDKLRLQARSIITNEPALRGAYASPRDACIAMTESELELPEAKAGTSSIDFTDRTLAQVYFDMESDPYSGVEYLFGLMVDPPGKRGARKKGQAEYFMAKDYTPASEQKAFKGFLNRMDQIKKEYGEEGFVIFHYAHYEPTHLEKLAEKFEADLPTLIDKVDYFNRRMVDLYKLIKKTYFLPLRSYSIKDVAPCIKSLMEKKGLKGGHKWKKIQGLDELQQELRKNRWSKNEIKASVKELAFYGDWIENKLTGLDDF